MRGDVDGYTAEFNPVNTSYKAWYPAYKNVKMWRLVGNGFITLDEEKKRLAMYKELQRLLLEEQLQVPLVAVTKFQVFRKRVKNMYVAFSEFTTPVSRPRGWSDRRGGGTPVVPDQPPPSARHTGEPEQDLPAGRAGLRSKHAVHWQLNTLWDNDESLWRRRG